MKFIQLMNGDTFNFEEVANVTYETKEYFKDREQIYSYIIDKRGERHDFLDLPMSFGDKNLNDVKLDADHVISLHKYAIEYIIKSDKYVLSFDEIEDMAWEMFCREYNDKINT